MKRERDPTPEEFEKLLAWLDPDRDEAGRKFDVIHSRLIKVFASRGCVDSGSLADEVMNRVAVRIDSVRQNYTDPLRCCLGFVGNVHLEYLREQQKIANLVPPPPRPPPDVLEKEDECLTQCMSTLTKQDQALFAGYFRGEKRARINSRKKLASELALTANALRLRAFKLRQRLHQCLVECLNNA